MREKQARGWDGETHKGGTEKRTTYGTDGRTDRGSYRGGAHLKMTAMAKSTKHILQQKNVVAGKNLPYDF